ncbi:uncharacterized protein DS421_10g294390 [Arachis hypogaea]|nr:uncharacterized protein DS421_10g294390 [Arachis hypogaea]
MLRFPPQPIWDLTIQPPKEAQHSRWHIDPGSVSDTICNIPDHPLARYCPISHTRPRGFAFHDRDDSRNPPHSLIKTRQVRERYPHPYKAQSKEKKTLERKKMDAPVVSLSEKYYFHVFSHRISLAFNKASCLASSTCPASSGITGTVARMVAVYNSPYQLLARYCSLWHTRPHGFTFDVRVDSRSTLHSLIKTRHARERYPHPYKACFAPLSNRCGTLQCTP